MVGGKGMKKKIIVVGVILIAMGGLVIGAIKNKPKTEDTIAGYKEGPRVQVVHVKKQDIETNLSSSGKLEAVNSESLYLDVSNKITAIHKEEGDHVKKGELILTLDEQVRTETKNQQLSLEKKIAAAKQELTHLQEVAPKGDILSAKANLAALQQTQEQTKRGITQSKEDIEALQKKLEDSENELKMTEELLAAGLAAENDVEKLKTAILDGKLQLSKLEDSIALSENSLKTVALQIETAQYQLDVLENKVIDQRTQEAIASKQNMILDLENQLHTNEQTLKKIVTKVVAPISGIITYLPEHEGMSLPAGSQLVSVVDPTQLEVTCDVSTYYASDLKEGLEATIKYSGSNTVEVVGKVEKVSPVATTEQTTSGESISIPVKIQIEEPGDIIRPGFNVDVKIKTDSRIGVCVVPILAVEEDEDKSYVYVIDEEGTLEKREVVQGISDGLDIEVSGVEEGELIVGSIEEYVADGVKVSYEKIGENQ